MNDEAKATLGMIGALISIGFSIVLFVLATIAFLFGEYDKAAACVGFSISFEITAREQHKRANQWAIRAGLIDPEETR